MSKIRKIISAVMAAVMSLSLLPVNLSALEAYDPYSYDRWWEPIPSQVGYFADYFADGNTLGAGAFNEPADLHVSHDNLMYIADRNNNRIVVTDIELKNVVRIMDSFTFEGYVVPMVDVVVEENGETVAKQVKSRPRDDNGIMRLNRPTGIFVCRYTGFIYICDHDNERVLKVDTDGNVDRVFEKPDSEVYSSDLSYNPNKVIVDKAGIVYVVVRAVTRGAVMFGPDGEFLGFYGANRVETTAEVLANAFWNLVLTEEQRMRRRRATPIGFTNFAIDDAGFIYTVTDTQEVETDLLKKLNPRGDNIIDASGVEDDWIFGDMPPVYYSIHANRSSLTDVIIGPNGEINILDFQHGRIFQYDKEFWLMFIMGGTGDQLGTFRSPVAIEAHENKLFVLDSRKGNITVFTRTVFGEIVTEAANLYIDGFFEESLEPWRDVLRYDGNYRRAYGGIGAALFGMHEYGEAMKYFRIARYQGYYSRAFAGWRAQFLRDYFNLIMTLLIILVTGFYVLRLLFRREILKLPKIFKRKEVPRL